jgi:putative ABC transport system permease protein
MLQDIKYGLKLLWKHKAFTLAALTTLGLCIGANSAVFTILNTVVLRDLPFPEADRLVTMYNLYPGLGVADRGANSVPDYLDRKKFTDMFEEVALFGNRGYDVGAEGSAQRISAEYVTPSYFRVLRTQPLLGRTFTDDEAVQGKDRVAILSEAFWGEMFARDPNVLGRDIRLSGVNHKIVGVMPGSYSVLNTDRKLWVPFALDPDQTKDDARHSDSYGMIARLNRGVALEAARQRIDAYNKAYIETSSLRSLLESAHYQTKIVGTKALMIRSVKESLYLLQAAVLLVLLIGCVNLANLMLVRTSSRIKELAVRFSLGAGRWRLSRQLLTESITISVLGGLLGIAIAFVCLRLFSYFGADQLPSGTSIEIDGRVLAFTLGMTVLTGLAFGSIPLLHLFKRDLMEVFRGNERMGTAGRQALSLRAALVVSQVSLAFVVLIASGLLTRSFMRLLAVDPGFRTEKIVTAQFSLPSNRYREDAQKRNFVESMLAKMRSIPGVKSSGITTYLPFSGKYNGSGIEIEGRQKAPGDTPPVPAINTIDSGYLPAMGIPILAGRNFAEGDGPDSLHVVMVDQFMAHKYWPKGDAIGAKIHDMDSPKDNFTVIGIVGNVKTSDLAEQNPVGQLYFHYKQKAPDNMHIVIRGETDGIMLTSAMRRELSQTDPELSLYDTKAMPERMSQSLLNRQAAMVLCLVFAGLALLLSAIGIYGVLAYSVTQRTREIGIRMALGAETRDVLRLILGQGVKVTMIGLALGGVGAFFLTRAMSALLYEVKPHDPLVFLLTGGLLTAVALIASLIPSLRAVWIQPSEALRQE